MMLMLIGYGIRLGIGPGVRLSIGIILGIRSIRLGIRLDVRLDIRLGIGRGVRLGIRRGAELQFLVDWPHPVLREVASVWCWQGVCWLEGCWPVLEHWFLAPLVGAAGWGPGLRSSL